MALAAPVSNQSSSADWPEGQQLPSLTGGTGMSAQPLQPPHTYTGHMRLRPPHPPHPLTQGPHSTAVLGEPRSWPLARRVCHFVVRYASVLVLLRWPANCVTPLSNNNYQLTLALLLSSRRSYLRTFLLTSLFFKASRSSPFLFSSRCFVFCSLSEENIASAIETTWAINRGGRLTLIQAHHKHGPERLVCSESRTETGLAV